MILNVSAAFSSNADVANSAARHAKLLHAAQQFEGVMLGELMKPLGKASSLGGEDTEGSGNAMQGYGVEAVAGALARSGALGFANRIVAAVGREPVKATSEKTADNTKPFQILVDNPRGGK